MRFAFEFLLLNAALTLGLGDALSLLLDVEGVVRFHDSGGLGLFPPHAFGVGRRGAVAFNLFRGGLDLIDSPVPHRVGPPLVHKLLLELSDSLVHRLDAEPFRLARRRRWRWRKRHGASPTVDLRQLRIWGGMPPRWHGCHGALARPLAGRVGALARTPNMGPRALMRC